MKHHRQNPDTATIHHLKDTQRTYVMSSWCHF